MGTDEKRSLFTIRVASQLSGVASGTIREYERQGLLRVYRGPSSRHRLFSALEIKWIGQIWRLIHDEGLNMEGIRRLLVMEPCHRIIRCDARVRDGCPAFHQEDRPCWATHEAPSCCGDSGRICQSCPAYLRSRQSPVLMPRPKNRSSQLDLEEEEKNENIG
ncbi:MAG: MerR family transcriptional regulator [bacterium]|nr:MerR family transcriptional regulator [bacterium]